MPQTTSPNEVTGSNKIIFSPNEITTSSEGLIPSNTTESAEAPDDDDTKHEDECWYRDSTKLAFFVMGCLFVFVLFSTGCARARGHCRCSGYEDIARKGLAGNEYQHNNGDLPGSQNKSYEPL